jgi:hypothetical protein
VIFWLWLGLNDYFMMPYEFVWQFESSSGWRRRQHEPLKYWHPTTTLHCVTTRRMDLWNVGILPQTLHCVTTRRMDLWNVGILPQTLYCVITKKTWTWIVTVVKISKTHWYDYVLNSERGTVASERDITLYNFRKSGVHSSQFTSGVRSCAVQFEFCFMPL